MEGWEVGEERMEREEGRKTMIAMQNKWKKNFHQKPNEEIIALHEITKKQNS